MKKNTDNKKTNRFAAIHLGSEKICLQIVEFHGFRDIRVVDMAEREVFLAEETFRTGRISFSTVSEICDLLKGFKRLLIEYDVKDYQLIATTAIREAENQNYIIDQIRVRTGFEVKVIDMPQEVYLIYMALWKTVSEQNLIKQDDSVLFVDISSGGLGITLYRDSSMCYQQNIHLGALRIKESFAKVQRDAMSFHRALSEYIYSNIQPVRESLANRSVNQLVLSGWETKLLFKLMGITVRNRELTLIAKSDFNEIYNQVKGLNISQLKRKHNLTNDEAEMAIPTIVLYKQIIEMTGIKNIFIPRASMIDGICLLHVARYTDDPWLDLIEKQIISMAHAIGSKYQYDQKHATIVEQLAVVIFDKMKRIHGLSKRDKLLLRLAAILHDIGNYISLRSYYFHTYRLIISSDIIGLSNLEKEIVGNLAYYTAKKPRVEDEQFARLDKSEQVRVGKLAAILRLADAVDRSHRQKVLMCDVQLKGDELFLYCQINEDMTLEEWTVNDKAEFFVEVFGVRPQLIKELV